QKGRGRLAIHLERTVQARCVSRLLSFRTRFLRLSDFLDCLAFVMTFARLFVERLGAELILDTESVSHQLSDECFLSRRGCGLPLCCSFVPVWSLHFRPRQARTIEAVSPRPVGMFI